MCWSQAGYISKNDPNQNIFVRELICLTTLGEEAALATKNAELGFLEPFSLLEYSLSRNGLGREIGTRLLR